MIRAAMRCFTVSLVGALMAGRLGAAEVRGGTLRIESTPAGARAFVRTGGLNGCAEVGSTPLTLRGVEPGLLEYVLLCDDRQLYDGSLWVEAGREHVELVELEPGRLFFVDAQHPAASDANPGTEARPWKTIRHAADVLVAGDTALVKQGRYLEHWDKWKQGMWATPSLAPLHSGEPGKPIVFRAFPGHDALVTGDQRACLGGGRSHIQWIGLRTDKTIMLYGAKHCAAINVERIGQFRETRDNHDGFRIQSAEHVVLSNCVIHGVRGLSWNSAGIKCYDVTRLLVEHCDISNCHSCVFDKQGGQHNVYRRCLLRDLQTEPTPGGPIFQMYTQGHKPTDGCELYHNLLLGGGVYYNTSAHTDPFRVHDNTFVGGGVGSKGRRVLLMFNNVFDGAGGPRGEDGAGYRLIKSPELPDSDYNLFSPDAMIRFAVYTPEERRFRSLAAWQQAHGLERHSLTGAPRFADADRRDFRLRADSPCIDKGRPFTYAVGEGRETETLVVRWAWSFFPGDAIQIGEEGRAQRRSVVEVIDGTRLRLDRPASWSDGDGVTPPFAGSAPDIGACEHGDPRLVIGPTWRAYPKRRFSGAGE